MAKKTNKRTKTMAKESLQDKIVRIQQEFDEAIVISFSCDEQHHIQLEMCLPLRRWNADADDGDEDSEFRRVPARKELTNSMMNSREGYFG